VQLLQFADNPKSTVDQVFDLIASVAKTSLPEQGKNFLRTVIENGRLNACCRKLPTSFAH
jgi:F-type H+-transporting ATPase subunit delta